MNERDTPPDPIPAVREKTFGDLCASTDAATAAANRCANEIVALRDEHRQTHNLVQDVVRLARPAYVNVAIAAIPISIFVLALVFFARSAGAVP